VTRGSRYLLLALIASTVTILDQATKYWITQSMRLHESIPVIPNLFSFTYIRNPGAAFGLLAGSSNAFRTVFFGVTSLLALALLVTILVRLHDKDWIGQVSIAGILGGAIGNLIDRCIGAGGVPDFLNFYFGSYNFPTFNVADMFISIGSVLLAIYLFFVYKPGDVNLRIFKKIIK